MATKLIVLAGLVGGFAVLPAFAAETPIGPALGCARNPAVTGACFTVKGHVAVYNGSPSVRIHPHGSKRLLGVVPSAEEIMPTELKSAIGVGRDAVAEMLVCPITKREPGRMQLVCIESAKNIRSIAGK